MSRCGILPLTFGNPDDHDRVRQGDTLEIEHAVNMLRQGNTTLVRNATRNAVFATEHGLSGRQLDAVLAGSLINVVRQRRLLHRPGLCHGRLSTPTRPSAVKMTPRDGCEAGSVAWKAVERRQTGSIIRVQRLALVQAIKNQAA